MPKPANGWDGQPIGYADLGTGAIEGAPSGKSTNTAPEAKKETQVRMNTCVSKITGRLASNRKPNDSSRTTVTRIRVFLTAMIRPRRAGRLSRTLAVCKANFHELRQRI